MTTIDLASVEENVQECSAQATSCMLPPIALHQRDYEMLTRAAAIAGYDINQFAKLVIYRSSQSVVDGDPENWLSSLPVSRPFMGATATRDVGTPAACLSNMICSDNRGADRAPPSPLTQR